MATNQPLTLQSVQDFFGHTASQPTSQLLNPNTILKMVCESFGVTLKDLQGKKRTQNLVIPRHLAMYLLRNDLDLNLETIGQLLGGRDHTTIMHGIDKVARTINTDTQLRSSIDSIRQAVK
jgi:chromosomal replication initiator protein